MKDEPVILPLGHVKDVRALCAALTRLMATKPVPIMYVGTMRTAWDPKAGYGKAPRTIAAYLRKLPKHAPVTVWTELEHGPLDDVVHQSKQLVVHVVHGGLDDEPPCGEAKLCTSVRVPGC